jgi:hypothetical protein
MNKYTVVGGKVFDQGGNVAGKIDRSGKIVMYSQSTSETVDQASGKEPVFIEKDSVSKGIELSGVNSSVALSARMARAKRIALWGGSVYLLPKGLINLYELGPFLDIQTYDPLRQIWVFPKTQMRGWVPEFFSDGMSHRVVNSIGCTIHATVVNAGSGYSSIVPPVITPTSDPAGGPKKPLLRAIVGGGVRVTIVSGGEYDYPPVLQWDYSQQTGPIRPIQIDLAINSVGVVTTVNYDGNDTATALGATNADPNACSGAGIDVSKLTYRLVRHPSDTKTVDAVLSVASHGAGKVLAADVLDMGAYVGDVDAAGAVSITHNGGTGLQVRLINNHYVTGMQIVDGGDYRDSTTDDPFNSGGGDYIYPPVHFAADKDDEQSRPIACTGTAVITNGAVTYVDFGGIGPGIQQRPRAFVGSAPDIKVVRHAKLRPVLGSGGDYFSYELR